MSLDGFKYVFDKSEYLFNNNISVDFSKFREEGDIWWFLLGNDLHDFDALSKANNINTELFSKYLSVPKSDLGYTDNVKYKFMDVADSRHIMMSCLIFSQKNDFNNIVELGGGYGNWYRLNKDIVNHNSWSIIDLPFVLELQKWYLSNEVKDLSKVNFFSPDDYKKELSNKKIDLVIAAHSLSELSWNIFLDYFNFLILKTEYLFYASHVNNCGEELLNMKKNEIEKYFTPVFSIQSEYNSVFNTLYRKI